MKLNNRGVTLVELVISIGLISILITFLFRLLVDVRYSNNNIDFARSNQQTRAIILKTIQTDFLERKLVGLIDSNTSNTITIELSYADETKGTLLVDASSVTYTLRNSGGGVINTEKWILEKENDNTKFDINCVSYSTSIHNITDGEFFYVKFNIPVTTNPSIKNHIDDLEFFYVGEKQGVVKTDFRNKITLGYNPTNCH